MDGIVRIDDAVARAAADGMPALALTDAGNVFGMVKFYSARAPPASSRSSAAMSGSRTTRDRDKPHRAAAPRAHRAPATCACPTAVARLAREPAPRRAPRSRSDWFAEGGTEGLIALSGARGRRRRRRRSLAGQRGRGRDARRGMGEAFPGALLPRGAARRARRNARRCVDARGRARGAAAACRWSRRTRCSSSAARTSRRTRRASASRRATCSATSAGRSAFTPEQYFKTQAEMAQLFADLPQALENSVEIARRCNLEIELGKSRLPAFPTPHGVSLDDYLAAEAARGPRAAAREAVPDAAARERHAPRYRERLDFEIEDHRADGLRRLLPDRRRLHQLGEDERRAGRARAAARARARWSPTRSASPTSIRCATTCCSSASSIPSACRCPTSTSTSARTGATASSIRAQKYGAERVSQIATFGTMAAQRGGARRRPRARPAATTSATRSRS